MKVITEVCCIIIAARKKRWAELCQDDTTVDDTKLQDIVLTVPDDDGGVRHLLLAAALVLEDGEASPQVSSTTCSTIEGMVMHLTRLRAVMEREHSDDIESYDRPGPEEMAMAKLEGGILSSDNASPATATADCIKKYILETARSRSDSKNAERESEGLDPLPLPTFHVYIKRCWNHLRCT